MADVYSYGVVLWEVLTRAEPYKGKRKPEIFLGVTKQGMRPPIPTLNGDRANTTDVTGDWSMGGVREDEAEINEVIKEYNKDPYTIQTFDRVGHFVF